MANKLGYIYPKRIDRVLAGDTNLFGTSFVMANRKEVSEKKESDEAIYDKYRQPFNCPRCGKIMNGKFDSKSWYSRGHCFDCVLEYENYLRSHGLYEKYEEQLTLRNYKAFLLDVKNQAVEMINNIKDTNHIVNEDGSFDIINGDSSKIREFLAKEIADIDEKLKEVEDVDMSITAEEAIGTNKHEINKGIIEMKKMQDSIRKEQMELQKKSKKN